MKKSPFRPLTKYQKALINHYTMKTSTINTTATANHRFKRTKCKAFTLIEILIAVGIIALIVAIAIPALSSSKADSERRSAEGRAKVLNEARDRAILGNVGGITSIDDWTNAYGTTNDSVAAVAFLLENNLIRAGAQQ
jgi:prepilin-type N-terminal cleavage/methylation domain-containing protein